MFRQALAAVVLACGAASAGAVVLAASTFDTDSEGWVAQNGAAGFQWMATGGESGGFIRAIDSSGGLVWGFAAPAAFLGNQSAAYGGTLSYSLRAVPLTNPFSEAYPDVKLTGAGLTLAIDAGPNPGNDWTAYSVSLSAGAWHLDDLSGPLATPAQMQAVLADLTAVRIRAEFSNSIDIGGLDSVTLAAPVPEPASSLLFAAGLSLLGLTLLRKG